MSMFFGGFSAPVNIEIAYHATPERKYRDSVSATTGLPQRTYIYSNGDDIAGEVKIGVGGGKRLDHLGVKVELKGVIEITSDKGGHSHEFVSMVKELAAPGSISGLAAYQFRFPRAELPHESYEGLNAVCRYYVRASVGRTATTSHATKEAELLVQNPQAAPEALTSASATADTSVKLEVGIEDCLHIEFEYDRTRLGLEDDVTGRVHFLLVRIRIKTMELALVRRETVGVAAGGGGGAGGPTGGTPESETLTRFEIMDGCPVRGEVIPVRMPLAGLDLTPTFGAQAAGHGAGFFSVRYFLNLVLLDEEDRRYFKQQELTLFRRDYETGASAAWGAAATSGSGAGAVAAAPAGAAAAPK